MTTTALLTFEKRLSDQVTVSIRNIPGKIGAGGEHDYRKQYVARKTAYRLEHLMNVARQRMANGETTISFDFSDDV